MNRASIALITLLALTLLGALGSLLNNDPDLRTIHGPGWSAQIPDRWQRQGEFYVGPDRANLLVNVRSIAAPIASLAENTRRDLHVRLDGYILLSERLEETERGVAHILDGRYTHDQIPVRTTTGVFERPGSANKVVVTLSVVEEAFPTNAATFEMILASVRLE